MDSLGCSVRSLHGLYPVLQTLAAIYGLICPRSSTCVCACVCVWVNAGSLFSHSVLAYALLFLEASSTPQSKASSVSIILPVNEPPSFCSLPSLPFLLPPPFQLCLHSWSNDRMEVTCNQPILQCKPTGPHDLTHKLTLLNPILFLLIFRC